MNNISNLVLGVMLWLLSGVTIHLVMRFSPIGVVDFISFVSDCGPGASSELERGCKSIRMWAIAFYELLHYVPIAIIYAMSLFKILAVVKLKFSLAAFALGYLVAHFFYLYWLDSFANVFTNTGILYTLTSWGSFFSVYTFFHVYKKHIR